MSPTPEVQVTPASYWPFRTADDGLLMAAAETGLAEVIVKLHAQFFFQFEGRDEIAGGGVGIGEGQRAAFHVGKAFDVAVGADIHGRVVTQRTVDLHVGEQRLDGIGVLKVDTCETGGPEARVFQLAGQKALHHASIVGGREEFHRNAETLFEVFLLAGVFSRSRSGCVSRPPSRADAENRHVLTPVLGGDGCSGGEPRLPPIADGGI